MGDVKKLDDYRPKKESLTIFRRVEIPHWFHNCALLEDKRIPVMKHISCIYCGLFEDEIERRKPTR